MKKDWHTGKAYHSGLDEGVGAGTWFSTAGRTLVVRNHAKKYMFLLMWLWCCCFDVCRYGRATDNMLGVFHGREH